MLNILFAGTPDFAATVLLRLADAGYPIAGVITQPDRPSGRGMLVRSSAVKQLAELRGWKIYQPTKLKDENIQKSLLATSADVLIVAAYGRLIPKLLLKSYPLGAINVHASLLPRWRGAAPIPRAIAEGDRETGISIMRMTEGLDEGPVYRMDVLEIGENETADELENRLALLGGESLLHVLNQLPDLSPQPQAKNATYANKISNDDGLILFSMTAKMIYRRIRAFATNPSCYFMREHERIRIASASLNYHKTYPTAPMGAIVDINEEGVLVQCADRPIRLIALQRPGRRMMSAAHVLQGLRLGINQSLLSA